MFSRVYRLKCENRPDYARREKIGHVTCVLKETIYHVAIFDASCQLP